MFEPEAHRGVSDCDAAYQYERSGKPECECEAFARWLVGDSTLPSLALVCSREVGMQLRMSLYICS